MHTTLILTLLELDVLVTLKLQHCGNNQSNNSVQLDKSVTQMEVVTHAQQVHTQTLTPQDNSVDQALKMRNTTMKIGNRITITHKEAILKTITR